MAFSFRLSAFRLVTITACAVAAVASGFADVDLESCAGQEVLTTESILVDRHVVNVTVSACPGFVPKDHAVNAEDSLLIRRLDFLSKRSLDEYLSSLQRRKAVQPQASPSECVNPSICHCGESCTVACQSFTNDPTPTVPDCDTLVTILRSLSTTIGQTFVQTTAFPNPIVVDFSTCRVAFGNIRTDGQAVEYCWDGLADNLSAVLSGCLSPHIGDGGTCTGSSNSWEMALSGVGRS